MSNDQIEEQIIEDIEEKDLVENQELEAEETAEEVVSEEIEVTEDEQPLSDAVLNVLLGEKAHEKEEEKEVEEDEHEDDEVSEEVEEDEELEEATKKEAKAPEAKGKATDVKAPDEDEIAADNDKAIDKSANDASKEVVELPEVKTKAGYIAASFSKLKEMRKSALVSAYKSLNPVAEGEHDDVKEMPKLKADMVNAMYGQLQAMKKDDLMAAYQKIMDAHCEDVNEEVEADHFAEDLKVLAEADQGLTDDFKAKASILFEGAVANKVAEIKESLETQYNEDLQEEVTYIRESLVEKIDSYLGYVVESWIEENQEFVDNKLRTEIAENFMKALQSTFTEHYIEVPDSKVDLIDELAEQATIANESLANAEAEKSELSRQVEELSREKIISEASVDLASTQAGKLAKLLEEVKYEDAETFAEKVATIKEGFFKDSENSEDEVVSESTETEIETKTIVEGEEHIDPMSKLPADMAKYVQQLSKFNK